MIQQGWGAVLRWGGKLSQNLAELAARKEEMKTDLHCLQAGSDFAPVGSGAQVPWALGRLFGAPKSPNSPQGHSLPTRFALKLTEKSDEGPILLLFFFFWSFFSFCSLSFFFHLFLIVICVGIMIMPIFMILSAHILNSSRGRSEGCDCLEVSLRFHFD